MVHPQSRKTKMWPASLAIAGGVFIILSIYTIYYNHRFSLLSFSQAIAGSAAIMIGLSFAMSGIGYWWDFLDTKVAYRKYLGLVGFWLALLYAITLLFVDSERYFYKFTTNLKTADFILGLSAMTILTFMAVISHTAVMRKFNPQNWRRLMRVGYLAYALLIIRGYILEHKIWWSWLDQLQGLPPPRLIISLFAITVIIFRGSVFIAKHLKKPHNRPLPPARITE